MVIGIELWKVHITLANMEKSFLHNQVSQYVAAGLIPPDYIHKKDTKISLKLKTKKGDIGCLRKVIK